MRSKRKQRKRLVVHHPQLQREPLVELAVGRVVRRRDHAVEPFEHLALELLVLEHLALVAFEPLVELHGEEGPGGRRGDLEPFVAEPVFGFILGHHEVARSTEREKPLPAQRLFLF